MVHGRIPQGIRLDMKDWISSFFLVLAAILMPFTLFLGVFSWLYPGTASR